MHVPWEQPCPLPASETHSFTAGMDDMVLGTRISPDMIHVENIESTKWRFLWQLSKYWHSKSR